MKFAEKTFYHLFVTCNCEGALSKAAESRDNAYAINLTPETHDQSFAMTSSFSNMMLATMLCFNLDKIDEIAAELEDVITAAERLAMTTGASLLISSAVMTSTVSSIWAQMR